MNKIKTLRLPRMLKPFNEGINFCLHFLLRFSLSLSILFLTGFLTAQGVSINANGDPADPSAALDISSLNKGLLIPRMASFQRAMIINPSRGLLIYDTDTNSFWYYSHIWTEIAGGSIPSGPAGGDLSGDYPTPNVVKLQNLDVSPLFPFDKQVLKWDALSNNWKGRNDSLFLPYNVSFGSPTKLFGITNNNTTAGSAAIFGQSGAVPSGINPGFTKGVWGDNANGMGVVGTSSNENGIFGSSIYNHGIVGYSGAVGFAGVYGGNAEGGIGVHGEVEEFGIGVFGQSLGTQGIAGAFQTSSPSHEDTTFIVTTQGIGDLSVFNVSNETNTKPGVHIQHAGNGMGLKVRLNKVSSAANGIDVLLQGTGIGVYSKSQNGIPGKFEITNASNSYPALLVGTTGLGTSLHVNSTHSGLTGNVVDVLNNGMGTGLSVASAKGKGAVLFNTDNTNSNTVLEVTNIGTNSTANFETSNATNNNAVVNILTNGTGHGLESVVSDTGSTSAAVYAVSLGQYGILGYATNTAIFGHSTGSTDGVGVFGQATIASANGIGVKGVSHSTNFTSGAVTGISSANGVAVYGESTAGGVGIYGKTTRPNGAAVYGINDAAQGQALRGSATGTDGIGVYGEAGNSNSNSIAAYFRNNNATNAKNIVHIQGNGTGRALYIESTNAGNSTDLITAKNNGSGNFINFQNSGGSTVAKLANNGNLSTEGTITVKGNKGIVRNSSATQLRMEIVTANIPEGSVSKYDEFNSPDEIQVNFGTAFSSAPAVSLGNVTAGGIGLLTLTIRDVTTTDCKILLWNYTGHDWNYPATTYKLIVVGPE